MMEERIVTNIADDLEGFAGIEEVGSFEELGDFCQKVLAVMGNLSAIRGFKGNTVKKDAVSSIAARGQYAYTSQVSCLV